MSDRHLYIGQDGQLCTIDDNYLLQVGRQFDDRFNPVSLDFYWKDEMAAAATGYPDVCFSASFYLFEILGLRHSDPGSFCTFVRRINTGAPLVVTQEKFSELLTINDRDVNYVIIQLRGYRRYLAEGGVWSVCQSSNYFLVSLVAWNRICDLCKQ